MHSWDEEIFLLKLKSARVSEQARANRARTRTHMAVMLETWTRNTWFHLAKRKIKHICFTYFFRLQLENLRPLIEKHDRTWCWSIDIFFSSLVFTRISEKKVRCQKKNKQFSKRKSEKKIFNATDLSSKIKEIVQLIGKEVNFKGNKHYLFSEVKISRKKNEGKKILKAAGKFRFYESLMATII